MRHTPTFFLSSAACVLALTLASAAFAQQTMPAGAASSAMTDTSSSDMNQRDASSQKMTPEDQPNDKADIKLAARVRRAIMKDEALSMSAHNVKLVAAKGVVSLRGPVANADEKAKIESDVSSVRGVSHVDNQLDVKTP